MQRCGRSGSDEGCVSAVEMCDEGDCGEDGADGEDFTSVFCDAGRGGHDGGGDGYSGNVSVH